MGTAFGPQHSSLYSFNLAQGAVLAAVTTAGLPRQLAVCRDPEGEGDCRWCRVFWQWIWYRRMCVWRLRCNWCCACDPLQGKGGRGSEFSVGRACGLSQDW